MTGTGTLARKTGDGGVRWLSEGHSAGRSIARMPARPDPAISGIHLLLAAGSRPALATNPGAAGLERISQRAIDKCGLRPLAHLFAHYPDARDRPGFAALGGVDPARADGRRRGPSLRGLQPAGRTRLRGLGRAGDSAGRARPLPQHPTRRIHHDVGYHTSRRAHASHSRRPPWCCSPAPSSSATAAWPPSAPTLSASSPWAWASRACCAPRRWIAGASPGPAP